MIDAGVGEEKDPGLSARPVRKRPDSLTPYAVNFPRVLSNWL